MSRKVCHWTVARLYPDPIAGERINIGVVVLDGEFRRGRWLQNWARVRSFAYDNFSVLYEHVQEFAGMTAAEIRWQAENGNGVIQFDPIQPSLENPDELLERLATRYLKDDEPMRLRPLFGKADPDHMARGTFTHEAEG